MLGALLGTVLIYKDTPATGQPPQTQSKSEPEREPEMMFETANEAVKAMLASPEYISADFARKKQLADDLLLRLYESRLIREYQYFAEDRFYSYVCADGSLGGISLLEDPYTSPSGPPIN